MGAKKVYEKLIKDYSETKNEKAYNRLLKLYSDKTQPIYDKNRLEQLRQIMKQKEIKVSNNDNASSFAPKKKLQTPQKNKATAVQSSFNNPDLYACVKKTKDLL